MTLNQTNSAFPSLPRRGRLGGGGRTPSRPDEADLRSPPPPHLRRRGRGQCVALAALLTLASSAALAQTTRPTTTPAGDFRTFVVTPAAPPAVATKYRFDYPIDERLDGNAALSYLHAITMLPDDEGLDAATDANFDNDDDAAFAAAVAAKCPWLDTKVPVFLEEGARRFRCDWELPIRDGGVDVLLPYLNQHRALSNYVSSKARLALVQNDTEQAIKLIRVGLQLGLRTDAGENALVSTLVSVGITHMMMDLVARTVEHPSSPNLYWALRAIPTPACNVAENIACDTAVLFIEVPGLKAAKTGELDAAQWVEAIALWRSKFGALGNTTSDPERDRRDREDRAGRMTDQSRIEAGDRAALEPARRHYASSRRVTLDVAAKVGDEKLVAVYHFDSWRAIDAKLTAAATLPYPQMLPLLRSAVEEWGKAKAAQPSNPFFLPELSPERGMLASARIDQKIAALAAVEAVRAYAAAHANALPPTLEAIIDTPAPMNPLTGRAFVYKFDGKSAVLSDDVEGVNYPLRYEIRLRE